MRFVHEVIIKGSLQIKFPPIWTHEKQRCEEPERKVRRERQKREERRREEKRREEKRRKKKRIHVPDKVGKSRNTAFPMFCGS